MGGFFMATINLRDYYPFYHDDAWIEISDELAREIKSWERKENNYKRKCRYHGHYSLDREDALEQKIAYQSYSPDALYDACLQYHLCHLVLPCLSDKQAKRIYAHYFLGLSKTEIAQAEGVGKAAVCESIDRGLQELRKMIREFF